MANHIYLEKVAFTGATDQFSQGLLLWKATFSFVLASQTLPCLFLEVVMLFFLIMISSLHPLCMLLLKADVLSLLIWFVSCLFTQEETQGG